MFGLVTKLIGGFWFKAVGITVIAGIAFGLANSYTNAIAMSEKQKAIADNANEQVVIWKAKFEETKKQREQEQAAVAHLLTEKEKLSADLQYAEKRIDEAVKQNAKSGDCSVTDIDAWAIKLLNDEAN